VRLEGLGQLKNPMTSSGIKPATFRLVAECLNQLRYRVPPRKIMLYFNFQKMTAIRPVPYFPHGESDGRMVKTQGTTLQPTDKKNYMQKVQAARPQSVSIVVKDREQD
jgi:hypothetical protein